MKILVKNLRGLPYSLDIGEWEDGMVRPLLAPKDTPGDTVDIGERVNPWSLNVQQIIRSLVVPPGSFRILTAVTGGYSVTASPPGQISVTFTEDPDDLVFLFFGGGGALTPAAHQTLRQLIHFVDEGPASGFVTGAYKEVIGGLFPTNITWWESSAKLQKIVEKIIVRTGTGSNIRPTPVTWRMYTPGPGLGTLVGEIVDTITYVGVAEASRLRAINL